MRMPVHKTERLPSGAKAPSRLRELMYGLKPVPSMVARSASHWNTGATNASSSSGGEDGYILIAVLFLVFLVLITLSIAAPKVAADIERDREIELQHRGMQYRRAIQLYYKKFAAYPPNMEALEKSNNIRFLRKRYKDPATGKDEWKLIHVGENKTPTAMGFFGQPMGGVAGSTIAGTGPGGVGQNIGSPAGGGAFGGGSAFGGGAGSAFGGSSVGGSQFGSNQIGSGSTFGSTSAGTTDPNSGTTGTTGTTGASGTGSTDPNAAGGSGTTAATTFGAGNGQTFGGGGIIGVESTSPKATILEYKKKKHFNEWEFVYDPQSERLTVGSSIGAAGQPVGTGTGTGFGNGVGAGNGFGNQPVVNSPSLNNGPPTAPPAQQPPQQ